MKNINTEWTIDQLISLNEHKALDPQPGSYQQQCRDALSRLSTTKELYMGVANTIDWLSWKADKQVRGLKDQIAWLKELNHNTFAGEVNHG